MSSRQASALEGRAQASAAARVHGPPAVADTQVTYAGLVTRALAFATDAAILNAVAITVAVVVGLGLSVLKVPHDTATWFAAVGGVLYIGWSVVYFVVGWSTTGQTPGNRIMRIRVQDVRTARPIHVTRAVLRLVGITLAAIPLGAGFVPILFNERRRGVPDWLGRTVVVYVPAEPGG